MANGDYRLNEMELDAIGEVMNISMGSAATAMSTILDRKVSITTPHIEFVDVSEFNFAFLEPVIGVVIKYVEGIDGANVLLLRQTDVAKIVAHLLSSDPEDMTELDEIGESAICEIMNQMMGSSASALATFLGRSVNISPPEIMNTAQEENVREMFAIKSESLVSIKFELKIEGLIESEFLSAMEPQLAKEIVSLSFGANGVSESDAAETQTPAPAAAAPPPAPAAAAPPSAPAQAPPQAPPPAPAAAVPPSAPYQPAPAPQPAPYQQAPAPQPAPAYAYAQPAPLAPGQAAYQAPPAGYYPPPPIERVPTTPYTFKAFDDGGAAYEQDNLDLVMAVPIQISVELGRTKRKIKDIADLGVGNIVELDRQAGDQVDVIANGRLIAKGDVVVVDDNYSVRITEIVKKPEEFA
ncbi:MAG: flagellar motor switch phosphatase FliY [Clostridiales Family XIII bacterium]|jgi:flagellar motor switch protein FliN/FliY|nr:flagellar motor switch phosphatase FliY [Clostridiales Family XIII bacterium]